MTRSLAQIRDDSRDALAGNYLLYFLVLVITGGLTALVDQVLSFFAPLSGREGFLFLTIVNLVLNCLVLIVSKLLQAGQYFLSLNIARFNHMSVSDLFLAFRYDTAKALGLSAFLALIETVCSAPMTLALSNLVYSGALSFGSGADVSVPTILLVAGGGVLGMVLLEMLIAFPFSQAVFLYIDHQEYSARECLMNSRALMKGHMLNYILLHLSLVGYFALCVISLGIGLIWVLPYLNVVRANYYMNLTGLYKPY